MPDTDTTPAGGAAIGQAIGASAAAMLATAALLYLGYAHRTGRTDLLRRIAGLRRPEHGPRPVGRRPRPARRRLAAGRGPRDVLGHLASHRQRAAIPVRSPTRPTT